MVVDFKRSVNFFGKTYKVGVNEIPPEVEKHWYFQVLVKDGLANEMAKAQVPVVAKAEPAEEPSKKQKKG